MLWVLDFMVAAEAGSTLRPTIAAAAEMVKIRRSI
jgi:hypothetical protein